MRYGLPTCALLLLAFFGGCGEIMRQEPSMEQIREARQQYPPLTEPFATASEGAEQVPYLVQRPRIQVDTVSDEVAMALGRIGPDAVPALVNALHDADPDVRYHATVSLAQMGPEAEIALPALVAALEDPVRRVRGGAARALGQIGPAAAEAIPALVQALHDNELDPSHDEVQPATYLEPVENQQ